MRTEGEVKALKKNTLEEFKRELEVWGISVMKAGTKKDSQDWEETEAGAEEGPLGELARVELQSQPN